MADVLAFRTEAAGVVSIVFARSRGVARKVTFDAANDAGYRIKFTDVRVRRWPDMDHAHRPGHQWAANRCLTPELVGAAP